MPTVTNALAMDCEMVGSGNTSILARVSLVNEYEEAVYDTFVKPTATVTDYRRSVSGVTASQLAQGKSFDVVKNDVMRLLQGRILVGHDLDQDLDVLKMTHPRQNIRDTSTYESFRTTYGKPSLKDLARKHLSLSIQEGSHDSLEDAKAAMKLYKLVKNRWG